MAPPSDPGPIRRDEQFELLLRNAREYAIFAMDPEARIVLWNAGAEALLGWTEAEAVGQLGEIVFTDEQRAAGVPEQELAVARRDGQAEDERWHVRKSGDRFWANGMMIGLRDGDGRVRGFAKILRDDTQAKAYRDSLEELTRTLEARVAERTAQVRALARALTEAETEERRRISTVLHDDLQQRVYAIRLATEQLARDLDGTPHGARAEQVHGWARETVALTRRLATDLHDVPGGPLADALRDLARHAEASHGLRVATRLDADADLADDSARALVLRAVRELLFNVVKHAGVGRATLTLAATADGVEVGVEDDGGGFDPEAVAPGTLGLASVRQRLALAGGRLDLDAAPGRGTRAMLSVPATDSGGDRQR